MNNKTYTIITGATSGIGYETAKKLYLKGHYLILGNRNPEKAKTLKEELLSLDSSGSIDLLQLDLSSMKSIREFTEKVKKNYDKIDILINNAGVFSRELAFTNEGFEMSKGVNYIGTYYLTELLVDKLKENDSAKIIMVSSIGCYWGKLKIKSNFFNKRVNSFLDYFNSKKANLVHTKELSKRLDNTNIVVKAADPGVVFSKIWKWRTKFGRSLEKIQKKIMKTAEEGSRIVVTLATTDKYDKDTNIFFQDNKPRKLPKKVLDSEYRKQFIEFTEQSIKQHINIKKT
ncbi:SDR family NAD(P)-dependent oxidoreductase [Mycoplasmatota bacterium WC30]